MREMFIKIVPKVFTDKQKEWRIVSYAYLFLEFDFVQLYLSSSESYHTKKRCCGHINNSKRNEVPESANFKRHATSFCLHWSKCFISKEKRFERDKFAVNE